MTWEKKKPLIIKSIITAMSIVIIDQLTKIIIRAQVPLNSSITVIKNFFNIVNVMNRGVAFGMLERFSIEQSKLFILLTIISIGVLFYFYLSFIKETQENKFIILSLAGIIGGAFGNFIDRLFRGYVTDFLHFYIKDYEWPAFNFADTCISLGAAGLIIYLIFHNDSLQEKTEGVQDA